MRILARISTLIASNVNALLNRAENPEYMLAQLVNDMEVGLQQARRYAATAIAAERQLQRELEQNRTQADWWNVKAREALTRGCDELARAALLRKHEHRALVDSLVLQHEEARRDSETLRTALRALEAPGRSPPEATCFDRPPSGNSGPKRGSSRHGPQALCICHLDG